MVVSALGSAVLFLMNRSPAALIHFFLCSFTVSFPSQNDGVPALVTLKKGLVALARQWMKFIVVTQGFKAIGLMRPNQLAKPKEPQQSPGETIVGLDNGAALQSDTSADGAEFEFDAGGIRSAALLYTGAIRVAVHLLPLARGSARSFI